VNHRVVVAPAAFWPHRAAAYIGDFLQRALAAVPDRAVFVALAGGSTPAAVYRHWMLQTPGDFDWSRVHLFLADERMVPPGHAESNFCMAREQLSGVLHLHAVNTSLTAERAAQEYERLIRNLVPLQPSQVPRFDLVLLGLGHDGHTASLFPGSPALDEQRVLVAATAHPQTGQQRVTFTLPLIHAAGHVIFLVAGGAKSGMLAQVLSARSDSELPAARAAAGSRDVTWIVDDLAFPGAVHA
jgi:6-phosphogluconolactonase